MAGRRMFPASWDQKPAALAPLNPALMLAAPAALAGAVLLLIFKAMPHAALLPSVSLAAIAAAAAAALAAFAVRRRLRGGTMTLMDVAGAFALIGCAAAMLSNEEAVRQTFGLAMTP
jgi:hypothetical protein